MTGRHGNTAVEAQRATDGIKYFILC